MANALKTNVWIDPLKGQEQMTADNYIFIVGVSRSGTSLMRKILNKSTEIALCDENYYLGHLIQSEGMRFKFRRFGDLTVDENVGRLVDYIYSDKFENYSRLKTLNWQWRWFVTEVPKKKMLERIMASDRSERGLFVVFMTLFAESQNALYRGEKTPAHIFYVSTIMEWFPEARFIHMMRDPRAIFVSEFRRRKEKSLSPPYKQLAKVDVLLKLFLLLQITWVWSDSFKRYRKNKKQYGDQYIQIKFEDLVGNVDTVLPELCTRLGVNFQDRMMAQSVISEGFQSGQQGFDADAAQRWRKHIPGWVEKWFRLIFKNDLEELGYKV